MSKKGFTLAEILVSLGIIGIVAALTIPVLILDYNTKQWDTAANVFEKKLEDTLKIMNSQSTLANHTTTEDFVDELAKHFKTNKICKNDELLSCFSNIVYWSNGDATPTEFNMKVITKAKNFGQKEWGTNIVGVQFANGTNALIAYNPTETCEQNPHSNQIIGEKCLAILYDTSAEKNPNMMGKDLRSNNNVIRLGTGCAFEIGNTCYSTTPFIPTPVTKDECEQMITEGYGISSCYHATDYWAGAVKACGGISKLPAQGQLSELIARTQKDSYFIQNIKSYGFTLNSNNALSIWSNNAYNDKNAYSWHASPTSSNSHNGPRSDNRRQVVCLGD